eukprot:4748490-Pyramimonas_sp.AAC.1
MARAAGVAAAARKGALSEHALPERLSLNLDPSFFAGAGGAGEDCMAAAEALQSARRAWLDEQEKACNALAKGAEMRERTRPKEEA